jgi:hypothetical protein
VRRRQDGGGPRSRPEAAPARSTRPTDRRRRCTRLRAGRQARAIAPDPERLQVRARPPARLRLPPPRAPHRLLRRLRLPLPPHRPPRAPRAPARPARPGSRGSDRATPASRCRTPIRSTSIATPWPGPTAAGPGSTRRPSDTQWRAGRPRAPRRPRPPRRSTRCTCRGGASSPSPPRPRPGTPGCPPRWSSRGPHPTRAIPGRWGCRRGTRRRASRADRRRPPAPPRTGSAGPGRRRLPLDRRSGRRPASRPRPSTPTSWRQRSIACRTCPAWP